MAWSRSTAPASCRKAPSGFGRGLLVSLDAGLAVRASDRPQSIAGWRPILGQAAAPGAAVTRPGSESGTTVGNQSLSIRVSGSQVAVARIHAPGNRVGVFQTATMTARFEGNSIAGSGPEHNSGGRTCDIALTRAQ
jgi:hypothetical protein